MFLSILRWHSVRSDMCFARCQGFAFVCSHQARAPAAHAGWVRLKCRAQGWSAGLSTCPGSPCWAVCTAPAGSPCWAVCMAPALWVPQQRACLLRALLYWLPGFGHGTNLSAAAGVCKTSSQTPKARHSLTRSCELLFISSGFARV